MFCMTVTRARLSHNARFSRTPFGSKKRKVLSAKRGLKGTLVSGNYKRARMLRNSKLEREKGTF